MNENFFDLADGSALFGVTPVSNQFILEDLPAAQGDQVRVYLYGLMLCHNGEMDMGVGEMANRLGLEEEDVLSAYRHWEFHGLVERISEQPPRYRYVSPIKRMMSESGAADSRHARFNESIYAIYGNDQALASEAMRIAQEWVDVHHLPEDVVLTLVRHLRNIHVKSFNSKNANRLVSRLIDERVTDVQDALRIFEEDEKQREGATRVLRALGIRKRGPSQPELDAYARWTGEWGFSADAVLAACAETLSSREPTFGYLDAILNRMRQSHGGITSADEMRRRQEERDRRFEAVKRLYRALGISAAPDEGALSVYESFLAIYPDEEIILLAAEQCGGTKRGDLPMVQQLLERWRERGLRSAAEIRAHVERCGEQDQFIRSLQEQWGMKARVSAADRSLLDRWEQEWGFSRELIRGCADWASGAERPMAYLDAVLRGLREKGIRTPEEAERQREKLPPAARQIRPVSAQQYHQREYREGDSPDWLMEQWKEMNGDAQ